jgi:acyl-CoA synthetase (AMP-forming)/AMP-acid ligase II
MSNANTQSQANTTAYADTDFHPFNSLVDLLRFRGSTSHNNTPQAQSTPFLSEATRRAFTVVDRLGEEIGGWTWQTLLDQADKIRHALLTKTDLKAQHEQHQNVHGGAGPRVALVFRKGEMLEFLAAFFGCHMAGMTAVPINVIGQFEEMTYILAHAKATLALTTEHNYRALNKDLSERHRMKGQGEGVKWPQGVTWWKTDTLAAGALGMRRSSNSGASRTGSKVGGNLSTATPATHLNNGNNSSSLSFSTKSSLLTSTAPSTSSSSSVDDFSPLPDIAYIEYTKSPNGEVKGVAISHRTILAQCRAISSSLESNPRRKQRLAATDTSVANEEASMLKSPLSPIPSAFTPSRHQQLEPADVVLSWLEPRQQVGLILGGLLGVYRGSHSVFLHSGATEIAGLWEQSAYRYGATMALGDYQGVRELIHNSSSASSAAPALLTSSLTSTSPQQTGSNSLGQLEAFLIDTIVIQPQLDIDLAKKVLAPLGVTSPEQVVIPISTLPEHGGMVFSMRDYLPFPSGSSKFDLGLQRIQIQEVQLKQRFLQGHSRKSETRCFYLLDREALKTNWIEVLATGQDAIDRALEVGVVLVSAFGYASLQGNTTAIIDAQATIYVRQQPI